MNRNQAVYMTREDETWLVPGARKDEQSITSDWQFTSQRLIDGVSIKEVKPVPAGYGYLTEVFRADWWDTKQFVDQIFQSLIQPGGISAWHAHEHTTDRLFVSQGSLQIVLYDHRPGSPTRGFINQFRFGAMRPALIIVPAKVWHGVQNLGPDAALLINAVDKAYQYEGPDHWRLPPDSAEVPFKFDTRRS